MFKQNKIALALALVGSMAAANVQAGIIGVGLTGETSVEVPLGGSPLSDSNSSSTEVDLFINSGVGSAYGESSARALDTGWFYLTSLAQSSASSNSMLTQTYSFQNNGDDGFFDFNFTVENGSLEISCAGDGYGGGYGYGGSCDSTSTSTAGYNANIDVSGNSVWNSAATLTLENDQFDLDATGTMLGGGYTSGDAIYGWSEQTFSIDLGFVAANEIIEIVYSISTESLAMDSIRAYTQFNDPFSVGRRAISITPSSATNVHAPGSLMLLGLSLLGFAAYRGKNRKD